MLGDPKPNGGRSRGALARRSERLFGLPDCRAGLTMPRMERLLGHAADWLRTRSGQTALVLAMLVFMFANGLLSLRNKTLTIDEPKHWRYGAHILAFNSDRFDDSKMPVSAWNALPRRIGELLPQFALSALLSDFQVARVMTLLASLGFALVVFLWSRALYGFVPALLSLVLFALDPNIIAHSQLITTDLYAAGTITLALYCLWRFNQARDWRHALLSALTLGLCQIAKYTGAYLVPLFPILLLASDAPRLLELVRQRSWNAIGRYLLRGMRFAAVYVVIGVLVVNIGFEFNRTFTPLRDYQFKSDLFVSLQQRLSPIGGTAVPVPYPYLQGLDWVAFNERTGTGYGPVYLLGQLRRGQGFPGYYFVAYLFKEPLAIQLLGLTAIAAYVWNRRRFHFLQNESFLLIPVAFFSVYFNFFFRAQIGFRFFIVALPLLQVFFASLLYGWPQVSRWKRPAVGGLLIYLALSVFSYYPFYLAYFNELVWDRRQAYKVLADSNLDWGQSDWYLQRYVASHPQAHVQPDSSVAGTVIVSVNTLVGVLGGPNHYHWLRAHFEPVDTIAYSYLVYQIPTDALDNLH